MKKCEIELQKILRYLSGKVETMAYKRNVKTSLKNVADLSTGSATLRYAAKYKKMLLGKNKQAKWIKFAAIDLACMLAVAIPFIFIGNDKETAPTYHVMEMGQYNPLSTGGKAVVNDEVYSVANTSAAGAAIVQAPNAVGELESAMEQLIATGSLSDIGSDDVRPKGTSDFLPIMQQRLMDLHFMEQDEPSNYYNYATEAAVREFQKQHGLLATGIANYQTLLLMFAEDASSNTISLGQEGQYVENIQERLAKMGYDISVTGIFDKKMEEIVRDFQKQNVLPETGNLTPEMEEVLFSSKVIGAKGEAYTIKSPQQSLQAQALIEIAYEQLGVKYVRGGRTPKGFDCSGLVYYCLTKSGYDMDYLTSSGWRSSGFERVSNMEDLQPGDICTFKGHVGIYVGYGKMIDASTNEGRVRLSSDINENRYWRENWDGARRLTQEPTN